LAIPAIVFCIDVHCYLRSLAAHVVVFAREISGYCDSLFFTMSRFVFAGEFRREGSRTMVVGKSRPLIFMNENSRRGGLDCTNAVRQEN
jgi:hypothetical protein